jgi:hypothetical protein
VVLWFGYIAREAEEGTTQGPIDSRKLLWKWDLEAASPLRAYAWEKAHEQAIKDVEAAKQAAEKERLKKLEHDF